MAKAEVLKLFNSQGKCKLKTAKMATILKV
jgi:hypothetical protein